MREGLCAAGATNVQIAQRTQGGRGPGKKPSVGRVCGEGVNTVCSHQSQPAPWGRGPLPPNPHGSPAARAQGVTSPPPPPPTSPLPSHPILVLHLEPVTEEVPRAVPQRGAVLLEVGLGWEPALGLLYDLGLAISWIVGRRRATRKWQRPETRMK